MGLTALGYKNYAKDAVITAYSTAATGLGVENVANDQGAAQYAWQTTSGIITAAAGAKIKIVPATPAQSWRCAGVFRTNLTPGATVTFSWYNVGSPSPTLVTSAARSGPPASYRQVIAILSADITADYLEIGFDDASNPDGFINIPLVYCGPLWLPAYGRTFRSAFGRQDRTERMATIGGQTFVTHRWQQRWLSLDFDAARASDEVWGYAMEIDRLARLGGNILAIPDVSSSNLQYEAVFGEMFTSDQMTYGMRTAQHVSWSARVTERL